MSHRAKHLRRNWVPERLEGAQERAAKQPAAEPHPRPARPMFNCANCPGVFRRPWQRRLHAYLGCQVAP